MRRWRLLAVVMLSFLGGGVFGLPVMADERAACRDSWQSDHEHFLQCVAKGIYDPCDDAGGTWGKGQCAWAYTEIAEQKIEAISEDIRRRLGGAKKRSALADFDNAEKSWLAYRKSYCRFTNAAEDLAEFEAAATSDMDLGFCERRLTEKHAEELQYLLRHEKEQQ